MEVCSAFTALSVLNLKYCNDMKHNFLTFLAIAAIGLCFTACESDDDNNEEIQQTIDGYEFVDLGLSVKWATCNVGARTPLDAGYYFQYGNPNAFDVKANANSLPAYEIGGTSYDPATANMGEKWRMPSYEEFYELYEKCDFRLITDGYGLRYVQVIGPNRNKMEFPLAGAYPYDNSQLQYDNYQAWLLSSSLDNSGNPRPYAFKVIYTNETTAPTLDITTNEVIRLSGVNIRAVSTAVADR